MSIEISRETEGRITDEARRQGISVNALLERLMNQHGAGASAGVRAAPELPVWHLGGVWWFIAEDNREAADRVEMEILATCRQLAKHPSASIA